MTSGQPTPNPLASRSFHLFGLAGAGMGPLAVVARHLGADVSGCDRAGRADVHAYLAQAGIVSQGPHDEAHVRPGTTLVATSVADVTEPEMVAAEAAGARWHRTDLLAKVLDTRPSVGVTGCHGKGTVTALTAAAMAASERDPLAVVGARVADFKGFTRLGLGPIVAEVDNSDLSLARVHADVAVVTHLDHDHPDLGNSLGDAIAGVGAFVSRARHRVILGPSARASALERHARAKVWRYGRDVSARVISQEQGETVLALRGPDGIRERAVLRMISARPAANAALAFAAAIAMGVDPAAAARGLSEVTGLSRRLEQVGMRDGVRIFDDCGAKHPVSLREGIRALRRHFPRAALTVVFEPYAPFVRTWGHRYARVLSMADRVVLVPAAYRRGFGDGAALGHAWAGASVPRATLANDRADGASIALRLTRAGDVLLFSSLDPEARVMAHQAVADEDA